MLSVLLCLADLCTAARGEEQSKPTNRDIYLSTAGQQANPSSPAPPSVKPTVKFWVEREKADGTRDFVLDEKGTFHSGDRVRFKFATNVPAYAYLVNKGSTGRIQVLRPGIAGMETRVKPHQVIVAPGDKSPLVFDENPGIEQLRLLISPRRIPEIEEFGAQTGDGDRTLTDKEAELWAQIESKAAGIGNRDLVLEQHGPASDNDTPGAYLTDHGSAGFVRPILASMSLRHEP